MEMTRIAKNRMLVMRLRGELDQRTADEARSALEREIKRSGAINIALDFGGVTFMDSSGIGMVIGRYKTVSSLGGRIIVYDASDQIIRLLEMAGLDRLVIIAPTLNEGIKLMKRGM